MQAPAVQKFIQEFSSFKKHQGPIPYSLTFDFGAHDQHVLINSIMHGDEVGSLPALMQVISELADGKTTFGGKVTFTLGNVEACKINKRFVEQDLNREFYDFNGCSLEKKRAQELASVIQTANFFLDLHQTIGPTKDSFYLLKDTPQTKLIAQYLAIAPYCIVSPAHDCINSGKKSGIEFAHDLGIPGIVVELSQKGLNAVAEQKAYQGILKTLALYDALAQNQSLPVLAAPNTQPQELKIVHKEPFGHASKKMADGLINLEAVTKNQILGQDENSEPIKSPADGLILFPKYPARDANGLAVGTLPTEMFLIAG